MKASPLQYQLANPSSGRRAWRPRLLAATVLAALSIPGSGMAQAPDPDAPYIFYLRSEVPSVDHEAIARTFIDQGMDVTTFWLPDDSLGAARSVASEVRALLRQGVSPERINVIGTGPTSSVAVLTSAIVGNREVKYVLLGQCDPTLKQDYRFNMSGRVLGIYDSADSASHSCRPLWSGSPRVRSRMQVVTNTGLGASLFDRPRDEWTRPVMAWVERGAVSVGEITLRQVKPSREASLASVEGRPHR